MSSITIPRHIKAKTAEALERLMVDVTVSNGFQQITFSGIQFAEGYWYAWYLSSVGSVVKINPVTIDNGAE